MGVAPGVDFGKAAKRAVRFSDATAAEFHAMSFLLVLFA